MKNTYVVWREEDLWVAQSLDTEVASQGVTKEEAIVNLKEALTLYFEDHDAVFVTREEPIFGQFELQNA